MPASSPFAELLAHDGVTEVLELRSSFGFLAFHGGSLERMTAEIATEAARRAGASLYAVLLPEGLHWHIPSVQVGAGASPSLVEFLDHVEVAVAVHGYGRQGGWLRLLLGGANRELATHLAAALRPALPDYAVDDDIDAIPAELRGLHRSNPVNRPLRGGVQLELPPRVRGMGPFWRDRREPGLTPHTEALVGALALAARTWPSGT